MLLRAQPIAETLNDYELIGSKVALQYELVFIVLLARSASSFSILSFLVDCIFIILCLRQLSMECVPIVVACLSNWVAP